MSNFRIARIVVLVLSTALLAGACGAASDGESVAEASGDAEASAPQGPSASPEAAPTPVETITTQATPTATATPVVPTPTVEPTPSNPYPEIEDIVWVNTDGGTCSDNFRHIPQAGANPWVEAGRDYLVQVCRGGSVLTFVDLETGEVSRFEEQYGFALTGQSVVTREPIAETATRSGEWTVTFTHLQDGTAEEYLYDSDLLERGSWIEGGFHVYNYRRSGDVYVYDLNTGEVEEIDTGFGYIEHVDEHLIAADWRQNTARMLNPTSPDEVTWSVAPKPESELVTTPSIDYLTADLVNIDDAAVDLATGEIIPWDEASFPFDWEPFRDQAYHHFGAIFISNNGFLARVDWGQNELWSIETGEVAVYADCYFWGGDYGVLARCDEGRDLFLIDAP